MTTINVTKGELVQLVNGLYTVQELKGREFGLAVSRNLDILQSELKDLEEMSKPSEEFLKLANQVNEIANEDSKDAKEKINVLEQENLELVEARKAQVEEVTELMKGEASVEIVLITMEALPEDITAKQINSIKQMIK